jgi:hypothetical protein
MNLCQHRNQSKSNGTNNESNSMAQKKNLTQRFIEAAELAAEENGWDLRLTFDEIARAVNNIDHEYRKKIVEADRAEKQRAFDLEFERRQLQYAKEAGSCDYIFELRRQWKSSGKDLVDVGGIRKSIFQDDTKTKGAAING